MPAKKKIEIQETPVSSPAWGSTTKLVVALTVVTLASILVWRFSTLVPPLLMVFILVYLLQPIVSFLSRILHISWVAAVNIIFLLIIVILLGLLTWGGVGLVQQLSSLIGTVQDVISNLPQYIASFSGKVYQVGLIKIDLTHLDLNYLSAQALSHIEPILSRTADFVSAAASGAAEFIGWTLFVITVSYFVMVEGTDLRDDLIKVNIPGYKDDVKRLNMELGQIWNAFLRGQILIFLLALAIYSVLLPILGVRYALGIALLAGLAKFLPYIGAFTTWVVLSLVTFFQPFKPFGIDPLVYTVIIVGVTMLIDQIIDNLVAPRIMAKALKVQPAAVLIAALVAASLLGLLGVVIAAPLLATITLFGRYIIRKMMDLDPWEGEEVYPEPLADSGILARLRRFLQTLSLKRD